MDFLAEARRRAFSFWLRTGRLPRWAKPGSPEVKYNPWHDAEDGRFTFAGSGRYFGAGSAGGSARSPNARMAKRPKEPFGGFAGGGPGFTGGGARGSWPAPDAKPEPNQNSGQPRHPEQTPSQENPRTNEAERNWQRIERNGYAFHVDDRGRTRRAEGKLTLKGGQPRSRRAQARAGGQDRRSSDDGGHYIARRFNGPSDAFNHFAQDSNFNRGLYRTLEDQWARALRAGKGVRVKIVPKYNRSSRRPAMINVWFWIDGHLESVRFPNEPRSSSHAE